MLQESLDHTAAVDVGGQRPLVARKDGSTGRPETAMDKSCPCTQKNAAEVKRGQVALYHFAPELEIAAHAVKCTPLGARYVRFIAVEASTVVSCSLLAFLSQLLSYSDHMFNMFIYFTYLQLWTWWFHSLFAGLMMFQLRHCIDNEAHRVGRHLFDAFLDHMISMPRFLGYFFGLPRTAPPKKKYIYIYIFFFSVALQDLFQWFCLTEGPRRNKTQLPPSRMLVMQSTTLFCSDEASITCKSFETAPIA